MESNEKLINGMEIPEYLIDGVKSCPYEIVDISKFLEHLKNKRQSETIQFIKIGDTTFDCNTPYHKMKFAESVTDEEKKSVENRRKIYNSLCVKSRNFLRSSIGGYTRDSSGMTPLHHQLLSNKKSVLLEYFGRLFTVEEVFSIVRKDWGQSEITQQMLLSFFRENIDEINRLREKHKNEFEHIRLTNKTSRLEELTFLYNKLKNKYEKAGSREDHRALLQTLDAIRKEVEGDKLTINGQIDLNIQQDVNIQIRNELMKTIPLKEIIIGRLASRMKLNPSELINDMNNSYYSRLNRLIVEAEDAEFEEVGFPSEQSYDFEMIESVNKKKDLDKRREVEKKKTEAEANKDPEKEKKDEDMKQALLEKLKTNIKNTRQQKEDLRNKFM